MNVMAFDEDAGHLYFITATGNLVTYDKKSGFFSFKKLQPAI
jgi:hypothetical protein